MIRNCKSVRSRSSLHDFRVIRLSLQSAASSGFTLPEVLVSAVVLVIATIGSIAAFNLIIQSVTGTGLRADQNRRIDAQITEINRRSEAFTACEDPEGAFPTSILAPGSDFSTQCGDDAEVGNSFYYIPEDPAEIEKFLEACRDGTMITNFIDQVDSTPDDADGVVERQDAAVVTDYDYLVEVAWIDPVRNRELRSLQISPILAGWCP